MRILTLVTGAEARPSALRLTGEIRTFNAEIDFRLRFLHVEIEEVYVVPAAMADEARGKTTNDVVPIDAADPLEAAARLALALELHRPEIVVLAGDGPLRAPGAAAARACGAPVAVFAGAAPGGDGLDLGAEAPAAIERLTGVAREFPK
jgi:hypothetical protein